MTAWSTPQSCKHHQSSTNGSHDIMLTIPHHNDHSTQPQQKPAHTQHAHLISKSTNTTAPQPQHCQHCIYHIRAERHVTAPKPVPGERLTCSSFDHNFTSSHSHTSAHSNGTQRDLGHTHYHITPSPRNPHNARPRPTQPLQYHSNHSTANEPHPCQYREKLVHAEMRWTAPRLVLGGLLTYSLEIHYETSPVNLN